MIHNCEWAKVAHAFPDLFPAATATVAHGVVMNHWPDAYETHTGIKPDASNSRLIAEREFNAETRERFVVRSAFGDWAMFVPKGQVGVAATRKSDETEAWFLVSEAEYQTRGRFGFVIDETIHTPITAPNAEGRSSRPREADTHA